MPPTPAAPLPTASFGRPQKYGRFSLEPVAVPPIDTPNRRICTPIPVPESIPVFETLLRHEPPAMGCQPPILWDHAEGWTVSDRFGNRWIDWTSCVLVANAGHAHPAIVDAVKRVLDRHQLATYVFAHEERATLVDKLARLSPRTGDRVLLLSTGSEAIEAIIKLGRTWGLRQSSRRRVIVSFQGGFHGRTLGSQLAGGIPSLKTWIGTEDPSFVQVPFPDGFRQRDQSFEVLTRELSARGVAPGDVALVVAESYLGGSAAFLPTPYAIALRDWCDRTGALLAFDEVQAGFGRTGRVFGFQHYGIVPDLIACGKSLSGSLPLAAVIGRSDVLSVYAPGSMTSTHAASPLPVAAGIAALEVLEREGLADRAARLEPVLRNGLERIASRWPQVVGRCNVRGLVAGLLLVTPGTDSPDGDLALRICEACFRKGLLLFAPVGDGGGCLKVAPPLVTPPAVLEEALSVFEEAFWEALGEA